MPRLRLFTSMCYTGALLMLCGYLYYALQHFEGEIYLAPQQGESLVIRESAESGGFGTLQRGAPAEALLFDNPDARKRLDRTGVYDGVNLPFRLHLAQVDVLETFPPEEQLQVSTYGETQELRLSGATPVVLEDTAYQRHGPAVWRGIVRNIRGPAMATVLLPAESGQPISVTVMADRWETLPGDRAVHFQWFEDEAAARAAFPDDRAAIAGCTWRIQEGTRTHDFDVIRRGDAMTLADGTRVVLLESRELRYGEGVPALRIGVVRGEEKSARWITEADSQDDPLARLECPGNRETLILIHAWREDEALIRVFAGNEATAIHRHVATEKIADDPGLPGLTLDQVARHGTKVPEAETAIHGVILDGPTRRIQLREGERRRLGETDLRYLRVPTPPRAAYTVQVHNLAGEAIDSLYLAPGETVRHGAWKFRVSPLHRDAATSAVLIATRAPGGWAHNLGVALFVLGAVGFSFQRFRRPGSRRGA